MNPPDIPSAGLLDRLKVLINSSTPIVVMETVFLVRALSLVGLACAQLNLAVFEWTIADGLVRSGSGAAASQAAPYSPSRVGALPQGNSEADRLPRVVLGTDRKSTRLNSSH